MGQFKGLIIVIEVALIGLVLLYIAYGRKGKKKKEDTGPREDVAIEDIDPDIQD